MVWVWYYGERQWCEDWLGRLCGSCALGLGSVPEFRFMTEVYVREKLESGRYAYEVVPPTGQVAGCREIERIELGFVRSIKLGMYMPGAEEPCGMVTGLVLRSRDRLLLEYVQRFVDSTGHGLEGGVQVVSWQLYQALSCVACTGWRVSCADSGAWGCVEYAYGPGPTYVFLQGMWLPDPVC